MLQFINKFAGKTVKIAGLALVLGASAGWLTLNCCIWRKNDAGSMVVLTLLTGGVLDHR